MNFEKNSEIGAIAAIGPFGQPAQSKYERLIAKAKQVQPATTVVVHPCDESSLRGATEAAEAGIIVPILVGPAAKIKAVAREHGLKIDSFEIVHVPHSEAAAARAVELIRESKGELLMKGSLHTDELMREVTSGKTGLRTARRVSHVFVMDVPTYSETLFITDAAINIFPDLDAKRDIVQNAIDLYTQTGLGTPRVAILSAVETVTSKIPSTIEAAALCKMADRGQITGGLLDGPLAFDNAIDPEAARIKGIKSEVAGRAQILVVPDLEAGNMLAKNLIFLAKADAAGIVLGARVPVILTSRAIPCAPAWLPARLRCSMPMRADASRPCRPLEPLCDPAHRCRVLEPQVQDIGDTFVAGGMPSCRYHCRDQRQYRVAANEKFERKNGNRNRLYEWHRSRDRTSACWGWLRCHVEWLRRGIGDRT